jgi:two-component system CheB/CheR fusion protein
MGKQTVTLSDVRVPRDNSTSVADITIEPLKAPRQAEGLSLVTFRNSPAVEHAPAAPAAAPSVADDEVQVHQLEDELKNTREDLQSNIDQLAASNEELKASNEEVTSINEELQSTNEELETSKEELQSLNEELSTVNSQLQVKVDELEVKTNDLNNLLSSTDIATIFLDRDFQIKWFTASTTRLTIASSCGAILPSRRVAGIFSEWWCGLSGKLLSVRPIGPTPPIYFGPSRNSSLRLSL